MSSSLPLPENSAEWEMLLLLIASEEKKIDRTNDAETDTMAYFLDNQGINHILFKWIDDMHSTYARKISVHNTAQKCDGVALNWRELGNDDFKANNIQSSYYRYNNSVLYAFQHRQNYALALANRSAALLRLNRYEECLKDIDRALSSKYPPKLWHKLFVRKADCCIQLGRRQKARIAIATAARHAMTQNLSNAQRMELDSQLRNLEKRLAENLRLQDPPPEPVVLPELHKGENQDFVSASSVLELRRSDTEGRHVVTREALNRGDVVFSEEPYAMVALPSDEPVCDECCEPATNFIPCKTCSGIVYCDEDCRKEAFPHHRFECSGVQAKIFATIGIAHLALRVLLKATAAGFPAIRTNGRVPTTAAELFRYYSDVNDSDMYNKNTNAFYRMFNLVTNFDKMNVMDYMQYAATATMLTIYLERFTEYFEELPGRVPGALPAAQLRVFAAALLLRALGQLVCNGHATLSLAVVHDGNLTSSEYEVRKATAIYPSTAMMNHSCDPNVSNVFYKGRIIVRCAREIPAGGQVLNCYGPHRARDRTAKRREMLRAQYHFTCNCTACLDTEHRDFVLLFSAYACSNCKGPIVQGHNNTCPQCHAPFNQQRIEEIWEESMRLLCQASGEKSQQRFLEKTHAAFKLQQQIWYRHNEELRRATNKLARLYADNGDFGKSVELVKLNINSLEYQYGSFSVEVANELRKLSDAMMGRVLRNPAAHDYRDWCLETHKIIKKAVQLMEFNYGSWTETVRRLKEQERVAATLVANTRSQDAADNIHTTMHYNLKI